MPRGDSSTQPRDSARGTATPADHFRRPRAADGATLWRLARAGGTLEVNSPYTYILLSDHFADTCVIAERDGMPTGFVAGYMIPDRNDTVFVWQIGVAPEARGRGLAKALLAALLEQTSKLGVRYLEATVTPSNKASEALFRAFARDHDAPCSLDPGYTEDLFPGGAHEAERCFRIGPLPRRAAASPSGSEAA